jgi:ABC-type sugar transport system ATPase subunit
VSLHGLSKTYPGGVEALRGVDIHVRSGELLVLLGPSGSGKTTLLRLIAGLETPTAGGVRIAGEPADRLPPHRRGVGLVSQRVVLFPHLSVRDNLRFGLPRGQDGSLSQVAELLRIGELLDRRPGELSGGQQQRVALGRALVRRPRVLLLDEPFSNLDAPLRWELRGQLHLLQRHLRATMILVTHEQDEALSLADRVAVLDRGRLAQLGTPREALDRLDGTPPIRLVPGELTTQGTVRLEKELSLPVPADWAGLGPRSVLVGLRAALLFDADSGKALRPGEAP